MSENYNCSSALALKGNKCALLMSTTSYNKSLLSVSRNHRIINEIVPNCFIVFTGLFTDGQTVFTAFRNKVDNYKIDHGCFPDVKILASMLSWFLYSKRTMPWYVEPLLVTVENGEAKIANMDLVGALTSDSNFQACGSSTEQLLGTCEAFYQEKLQSNDLVELGKVIFEKGTNRDALVSGMEAVLVDETGWKRYLFKGRAD